ncbi:hypothetical protein H8958_017450 [Nasalis larvatus]
MAAPSGVHLLVRRGFQGEVSYKVNPSSCSGHRRAQGHCNQKSERGTQQEKAVLGPVDMTTEEIDALVHREIISHNAYPSPLGYGGFPKSVCTSVNNVLCHGIPDSRPLQDGDIINIDVTVYYNGYHGDTSETFLVGNVDECGKKLVEVARRCRDEAIAACRAGAPFSVIGNTIRSAQFEHTVLITSRGVQILTKLPHEA